MIGTLISLVIYLIIVGVLWWAGKQAIDDVASASRRRRLARLASADDALINAS